MITAQDLQKKLLEIQIRARMAKMNGPVVGNEVELLYRHDMPIAIDSPILTSAKRPHPPVNSPKIKPDTSCMR